MASTEHSGSSGGEDQDLLYSCVGCVVHVQPWGLHPTIYSFYGAPWKLQMWGASWDFQDKHAGVSDLQV